MRTLYEIFDDAQTLMKHGWVSGHYAVDKDGRDVSPESDNAVAYCQMGALQAICYYEASDSAKLVKFCNSILNMANTGMMNYERVESRNDTHEQDLAIQMFENAKNYILTNNQMGPNYIPGWLKSAVGSK